MGDEEKTVVKRGDYTAAAETYAKYRPGYSPLILEALLCYIAKKPANLVVADIGAGTGIWTTMLAERNLQCFAVEPNDAMRKQGIKMTKNLKIEWRKGSAEKTALKTKSIDWVTAASSFHWAEPSKALKEFYRILKPNGFLTLLWNPRNIDHNPLHEKIEQIIYHFIPNLSRTSSGSQKHAPDYANIVEESGLFSDTLFFEANQTLVMSKERYLGIWETTNDVRTQTTPAVFRKMIREIQRTLKCYKSVEVPYKTRAWTAKKLFPNNLK